MAIGGIEQPSGYQLLNITVSVKPFNNHSFTESGPFDAWLNMRDERHTVWSRIAQLTETDMSRMVTLSGVCPRTPTLSLCDGGINHDHFNACT